MTRPFLLWSALLLALSGAVAVAAPQHRPDVPDYRVSFAVKSAPEPSQPDLLLTEASEVHLDGSPCPYADIPATAEIVLLEVAADRCTILKIHFRSKGK